MALSTCDITKHEHDTTLNHIHTLPTARVMAEFDLAASFIPSLHKPSALLPIARHTQSLLYLIETYPVTIVVGQTGSGKTTQIPQYLEQAGWCSEGKIIAVTQVTHPSSPSMLPPPSEYG